MMCWAWQSSRTLPCNVTSWADFRNLDCKLLRSGTLSSVIFSVMQPAHYADKSTIDFKSLDIKHLHRIARDPYKT